MARILIIDDSKMHATTAARILTNHGHLIKIAPNAEEGLKYAKNDLPDLILMDIVMPGMNGFQATRELQIHPETQHIPVIMVSTKDQDTDMVWGKRQGAQAYVVKPVTEESLMAVVEPLLKKD